MRFIQVTIGCIPEEVENLPEEVAEKVIQDEGSDWRKGYIDASRIVAFYPASEGGTIIHIENETQSLIISEPVHILKNLIDGNTKGTSSSNA